MHLYADAIVVAVHVNVDIDDDDPSAGRYALNSSLLHPTDLPSCIL